MEFQDISLGSLVQVLDRSVSIRLRDDSSGVFVTQKINMDSDKEVSLITVKYGKYIVKNISAADNNGNRFFDIEIQP